MPSTFSTNYHLELQATGEDAGTWGNNLNNNVFTILDNALGNKFSLPLTNVDVTLNTTQSQNLWIACSGTLTANVNVIFPEISRFYFVSNTTTGAFTVTLKTTNVASTSVVISQGTSAFVMLDGVSVFRTPDVFGPSSAVVSGNLPMFNGTSGRSLSDSGTAPPVIASTAQAQAATSDTVYMTPLKTYQQITAKFSSQAQAQAGTDQTTIMNPLRTAQAIDTQATAFPYTGTSSSNLIYPLGSYVLVATNDFNRNQTAAIYLDTDPTRYTTTVTGTALTGTWAARGRATGSGAGTLFVRIA